MFGLKKDKKEKNKQRVLETAIFNIAGNNKALAEVGIKFARACCTWQYMKTNPDKFTWQEAQKHITRCKDLLNRLNQADYKHEVYALVLGTYDMSLTVRK